VIRLDQGIFFRGTTNEVPQVLYILSYKSGLAYYNKMLKCSWLSL